LEVVAEVWYWSPAGMQQSKVHPALTGYIEKRIVEELLQEANRQGYQRGLAMAMQKIRES